MAATILVAGFLHLPNQGDALTYRFPRVFHWEWEGTWHWIENAREIYVNTAGTGYEWMMAFPFVVLKTDRLFFLYNVLSYVLLPGLIFQVFERLGVSRRVAYAWMWLLPTAAIYSLQGGDVGNDAIATTFFLAALLFAFVAIETGSAGFVVLVIIAGAIVTSFKLSNAPLMLPIAIAIAPTFRNWRRTLPATVCGLFLGVFCSFLPMATINQCKVGHFGGDPENQKRIMLNDSVAGIIGNSLQLAAQNMAPPVFPWALRWNAVSKEVLPAELRTYMHNEFPRFNLYVAELPGSGDRGLGMLPGLLLGVGLTVSSCSLCSRCISKCRRRFDSFESTQLSSRGDGGGSYSEARLIHRRKTRLTVYRLTIMISAVFSLVVFMTQMGSESTSRLIAPYYPLLVALTIYPATNLELVRKRWWRFIAVASAVSIWLVLLVYPARPLVPVEMILRNLPEGVLAFPLIQRAERVYGAYRIRGDALAPLREFIGPFEKKVAVIGVERELRTALWRPYGSRKVEMVNRRANPDDLRARGFQTRIINASAFEGGLAEAERWAAQGNLRIKGNASITFRVKSPDEQWLAVDLGLR